MHKYGQRCIREGATRMESERELVISMWTRLGDTHRETYHWGLEAVACQKDNLHVTSMGQFVSQNGGSMHFRRGVGVYGRKLTSGLSIGYESENRNRSPKVWPS